MATDTTVNELVINKLTQAQYDALTEKSPTELYFVTDANESIQLETLPIASADNLNKIYQYVGETSETYTNGSFYKCVENITITLSMMSSFVSSDSSATLDSEKFASQNPIFADAVASNTPYPAWRADYQEGGTWNVWTQTPNLSITADELTSVWGITISGTPEVGDMIAVMKQEETTYAWTEVVLGEKLPDQTDNTGKFLTTDGENASWSDKPLVNTATGTKSISIMTATATGGGAIAIGNNSGDYSTGAQATKTGAIAIGGGSPQGLYCARALGENCVAIGIRSTAGENSKRDAIAIGTSSDSAGNQSIAIGLYTNVTGHRSVLIGSNERGYLYSITENDTMYFQNNNGQFKLLNSNGTIPTDRYTITPTTAGTYVPKLTIAEDGTATREWAVDQIGDISTALTAILGE